MITNDGRTMNDGRTTANVETHGRASLRVKRTIRSRPTHNMTMTKKHLMLEKFQNKYRVPSNRLRGWNYAENGHYFITIVTHKRTQLFGRIVDGRMIMNDMGQIVHDEFFKSFVIRNELYLGEFVLMPNHLHAIVILDKNKCEIQDANVLHDANDMTCGNDGMNGTNDGRTTNDGCTTANVETHVRASLRSTLLTQLQRQPQSISSFIAGFKSSTIKRIDDWIDAHGSTMSKYNKNNPLWQANYHDHIIRNEMEYRNVADYILCNPRNWNDDSLK